MKKKAEIQNDPDNAMRSEYNFSGGVRGKHHHALQAGYTITICHEDGAKEVKTISPMQGAITLDPDVLAYFPDSESVNTVLRGLIRLLPGEQRHQSP